MSIEATPGYVELPTQTRAADVRSSSVDRNARTVTVVASTGAMVRRRNWWTEEDYDEQLVMDEARGLDLKRLRSVGVVLDNHRAYGSSANAIGAVTRAWVENGELLTELRFDTDEQAEIVFGKIERGILRAVSIGYDAEYERVKARDRDDGGERDLYRTKRIEPFEVSVVMMPADAGAVIRSAGGDKPALPTRRYAVRDREESSMSTQNAPAPAPEPENKNTETEKRAARLEGEDDAFTRMSAARSAAKIAGVTDEAEIEKAARSLKSTDAIRSHFMAKLEERQVGELPKSPHVTMERASESKAFELLDGAILSRALNGVDPRKVAAHNERAKANPELGLQEIKRPTDPDVVQLGRRRMIDIAEQFLRMHGVDTKRMSPNELAEKALSFRSGAGGLATTTDFAGILGNTANKMMLAGYAEVTSPWRELIGRRMDRPDFKQFSIFRRSAAPDLEVVNEHGEIKRANYNVGTPLVGQLATAGIEVGFTRQMLINDDLEAFTEGSLGLGDSAIRFEDDTVITTLLLGNPQLADGVDFFHADRGNLSTDAGTPDLASLVAVAKLFASMTENVQKAGNNSGVRARKTTQRVGGFLAAFTEALLINQILNPQGYAPTTASSAIPSNLLGLQAYDDARLQVETSSPDVFFGFSATRKAIVYGFLSGESGPRISQMAAIGTDGPVFRLLHDWYSAVGDPTAIVRVPKS